MKKNVVFHKYVKLTWKIGASGSLLIATITCKIRAVIIESKARNDKRVLRYSRGNEQSTLEETKTKKNS